MGNSFLDRHKAQLYSHPFIVGSLVGTSPLLPQIQSAKQTHIHIIEVRLDTFPQIHADLKSAERFSRHLLKDVARWVRKPLLLTIRAEEEGGAKFTKQVLSDRVRARLYASLLSLVEGVDIEIKHHALSRAITRQAHKKKVFVVHSSHHFSGSLNWAKIQKLARLSIHMGGDVFKLAVMIRTEKELRTFFRRSSLLPQSRKILIGMGEAGALSRILGFAFGSVFSYGHLGVSAAPGQWHAKDLAHIIQGIYPARVS